MNDSIIRTRYADALVKYVQETGNGNSVCAQAERLSRVLGEVPDLTRMMAAKDVVSDAKKRELLRAALGDPMVPELARFVDLLIDNGRIGSLRMILLDFKERYHRSLGFRKAHLKVAEQRGWYRLNTMGSNDAQQLMLQFRDEQQPIEEVKQPEDLSLSLFDTMI